MPAEVKKEIELEIAHVLFLDIVGYSKLSVNEQHARVDELNGIVRLSEQYQKAEAANRILKIPTGDGMALVFYKSPEEPAQCAFEISKAVGQAFLPAGSNQRQAGTACPTIADGHSQRTGQWCGGRERTDERGRRGHEPGPTSDGLWRRRTHSRVPSCGRGPGRIRTMATVSARYRHLRGETRCASERDQPLLR